MLKLKGTEKQVRWAEGIKYKMLKELESLKTAKDYMRYHFDREIDETEVDNAINYLNKIDDAKFFIENRFEKGTDLVVTIENLEIENNIRAEINNNVDKKDIDRIIHEVKHIDRRLKEEDIDTTDGLYDEEREPVKQIIATIRKSLLEGKIKSIREAEKIIEDKKMLKIALSEILLIK